MPSDDHAALMDRIYRYERHVYDPLRRLFLVGRDRLLEGLDVRPGERVLEVGCGTARNLVKLHRRCPDARLYGLDASAAMLRTARAKLRRRGLEEAIVLRRGLAEDLDPRATFGLDEPFDTVFFSYSLTMMPRWREALDAALRGLRAGGALHAVDFWDQADLPRWFRGLVKARLARYHVRFRPETLVHLEGLAAAGRGSLRLEPIRRRYAWYAVFITDRSPAEENRSRLC